MKYYYKGNEYEINEPYYRVVNQDLDDIKDVFTIRTDKDHKPTTKVQEVKFFYNGLEFRRKSLEDIVISITYFVGKESEIIVLENDYLIELLVPLDKISDVKNKLNSNLLEYISGEITEPNDINIILNKDTTIQGKTTPIDVRHTVEEYILDMTQTLAGVYKYLKDYLAKQGYEFQNSLRRTLARTTDVGIISYQDYLLDDFRLLPNFRNDITEYTLNMNIKLLTSSLPKHERILSEVKSLKFLTNVTRIPIKDKIGNDWIIPLKWDLNLTTNDIRDTSSDTVESFEISLNFSLITYNVRSTKYSKVSGIIRKIDNVRINSK